MPRSNFRHIERRGWAWRVAAVALPLAVTIASPAVAAIELSPHRAIYVVKLLKTKSGGSVADAHGAVFLEWRESCVGWTVEQRFNLQLAMEGGQDVETSITFSSFDLFGRLCGPNRPIVPISVMSTCKLVMIFNLSDRSRLRRRESLSRQPDMVYA